MGRGAARVGQPSWEFLREGGDIVVRGGGAPIVDLCWPIGYTSTATVAGAFLEVDADFAVPVKT